MGEFLSADYAGFENVYAGFTAALDEYDKTLASLDHELRTSLREWSGDARESYIERHEEWMAASRRMHTWLRDLRILIGHSHRTLKAADEKAAKNWPT
ncbi:WXG100 family type VII secretion target [Actinomadura sp. RB99]|uniref:WXG100 family type VII secretion target n=1 Tax=Actinomadura sp. RB99 TaxID=2691577 RepID=UPI0016857008|nr:WXG100 family type VII secretion target [Actinomadura sp. RB99]